MILSRGSMTIFASQPVSLILLLTTTALLASMALPSLASMRSQAFQDD